MATSHRLRFVVGVALGAALGVWLAHGFVADARRRVAAEVEQRKAVVALQAAASLVRRAGGDGEAARRLLAAWQAGTPGVAQVRLARGMQLEASTVPADVGELAVPRRLRREEKPLYDRAQRLATAVQTNKEEQGSRKPEVEAEPVGPGRDRALSVAAPVEVEGAAPGALELQTAELPPPPATGWGSFLLAWLLPVAAVGVASLLLGEKRAVLAVVSVACLAAALLLLLRTSTAMVEADRRLGAAAVAGRVQEQAALVQSLAASQPGLQPAASAPADWDVDGTRKPRGEIVMGPGGASGAASGVASGVASIDPQRLDAAVAVDLFELRRALLAADALALALLLLAGFGAFNRLGTTLVRHRQAYAYITPAIIGMVVLVFFPFSYGITLSFTDSNIYNTNQPIADLWVGFRNYVGILGDFEVSKRTEAGAFVINYLNFYWTLLFTIFWTVTNVVTGVTVGLVLALILNTRALAFRPIYRVLLILPWAMPNYITALIWKGMFHQQFGVINHALQIVGLDAVNWFDHPFTSFLTAYITNAWLSFPFMMVVSLGALQSIPADLYEAATVDGASRWQAFRAITLPSLRPALVPAVILSVVWTFNMFNIIFLVTGGEPTNSTEILITQAYKFAFERYRYGYAAAYSTVIFGILLVYGSIQNRITKATEA